MKEEGGKYADTKSASYSNPKKCLITCSPTYLLVFGHRVQQLGVQFGVVLGQGLVSVVIDELHYRQEGKRLREAIPPLSVINFY